MRTVMFLEACLTLASALPQAPPVERPKQAPAVTTPAGYPPAPKGFRWAQYPGGRWGLVQDGLAVPKGLTPAPSVPSVPACPPGGS